MKRLKYLTLAAVVAFAACDEGAETVVVPDPTGTVSGLVSIEGSAASGVTVTLSSGVTATTDASGAYSFTGVTAGAYTVTISGFASDVSFSATVKAVTISSAGQVATANFDGSYIRTSAILGSVTGAGAALSGVTVTLSGMSSSSTTTDAGGQYSFSGLRAGSYTVTISGFDAATYSFTTTSAAVSLSVGESEVVGFSGVLVTTAKISGWLFLDENDKDDIFSSGLEDALAVANVSVAIEGGSVSATPQATTVTDATGYYEFANLAAGSYRVTLTTTDPDIPGNVAFGGTTATPVVDVAAGENEVVNFPFDITQQAVQAYAYLGTDAGVATTPGPGHAPLANIVIDLYPTQATAAAHVTSGGATTTGRLDTETTDANGMVTFRYTRSADTSPAGAADDNIVFAVARAGTGTPPANLAINGETIIEIKFEAKDSIVAAPDSLDFLNNRVVLKFDAKDARGSALAGWNYRTFAFDTTAATIAFGGLNASGAFVLDDVVAPAALPVTYYFDLAGAQALANGHGFAQTPSASGGSVSGHFVSYVHRGTTLSTDTIYVGMQEVTFTDADLLVRVHDEEDDSTSSPTFTGGDALPAFNDAEAQLYNSSGTSIAGPLPVNAQGIVTFPNVATGTSTLTVRARRVNTVFDMLNDTIQTIVLDGTVQADTINSLGGGAGFSTFAMKHNDAGVGGFVRANDLTAANGIAVKIQATADNIQPRRAADTTVYVAGGAYFVPGMREGPYTVSVLDSVTAAGDSIWAFLGTKSTTTDMEGAAASPIVNFTATRMDTKIEGVVVNDRDADYNTLDPDEALSGITVNLIDDADGDGSVDTGEATIASTTTSATGAYSFTKLREDFYIVQAVSPTNATVLRALSATGAVTNTAGVRTQAALGTAAPTGICALANCTKQNLTRNVGNTSPPAQNDEFPRWNYLTGAAAADLVSPAGLGTAGPNETNAALTTAPTHFVHLFSTGTVTGKVVTTAGGTAVAGVRVTITRCQTAATAPSPPAQGACTAKHGTPSPHIQNVDTDASGNYTFNSLLEGVYVVDIAPATAGYTTIDTPAGVPGSYLATLAGNNDIETVPNFTIS